MALGSWGFKQKTIPIINIANDTTIATISLNRGYEDNFWADFGWTVEGDIPDGVHRGRWERGVPIGTGSTSNPANPSFDNAISKFDQYCYMTGNGGGNDEFDDVDDGTTILVSPPIPKNIDGAILNTIRYKYWVSRSTGSKDTLKVILTDGKREVIVNLREEGAYWNTNQTRIQSIVLNGIWGDTLRFKFVISDLPNTPNIVEAGIDAFSVEFLTPTIDLNENWKITAYPNPFNNMVTLDYQLDKLGEKAEIILSNILGQVVFSKKLATTEGSLSINENLVSGIYFIKIQSPNGVTRAIRVVKQ
jgi:Secretion system C-terminal sorting domain